MDAWIKILVVMMMFSAIGMIMPIFLDNPFVGLILMGVLLTMLVLTLEPATGKAMAEPDRVLDDGRRDSVPLSARRNAMAICFSVQLDFFTS